MISGTYLGSAAVAVVLAIVMISGAGNEWLFLAILVVCFFLASSGASAAYLTVSEIFPMETRALAIAFFYAVGTAVGGITGPLLFGRLIGSGEIGLVAVAFFIGAAVMALGGVVELLFGVKAEKAKLEDIAQPLTSDDASDEDSDDAAAGGTEPDSTDADRRDDAQQKSDDDAAREQRERLAASRGRISERDRRRREAAASGRGRLRPGPGSSIYSPWMRTSPPADQSETLDHEIETLAQATQERGVMSIRELSVAVSAKYWGPGRFRSALRQALIEGRIVNAGRGMVGPLQQPDSG